MSLLYRRCRPLWLLLALLPFLGACTLNLGPQIQSNADQLAARAAKLDTLLILTPDITIHELSAGDVKEERPEWSRAGQENVVKALRTELEGRQRKVKLLDPKTRYASLVKEVKDLHLAVVTSIYDHAVMSQGNMNIFPQRVENFDYSLGSVEELLRAYGADGMLVVRGQDNISSAGRKALGVVHAINPFSQGQRGGMTFLELVLTDARGDILWWQLQWNEGGVDLRDLAEATEFVQETLEGFPGVGA